MPLMRFRTWTNGRIGAMVDAKREDTRRRRIEKAVSQIAERKSLNWKYE